MRRGPLFPANHFLDYLLDLGLPRRSASPAFSNSHPLSASRLELLARQSCNFSLAKHDRHISQVTPEPFYEGFEIRIAGTEKD